MVETVLNYRKRKCYSESSFTLISTNRGKNHLLCKGKEPREIVALGGVTKCLLLTKTVNKCKMILIKKIINKNYKKG